MTPLAKPAVLKSLCLFVLACFLASLTGCVSMSEHKKLQTAFDQARAQLAEAENDYNKEKARADELQAKVDELTKLLNGSGDTTALLKDRDLLAKQLAELQAKYDALLKLNPQEGPLPTDINNLLRDLVKMYPDLLEFDERLGMIRFKSDLTFDLGSTEVKPRAKEALGKFAAILNNPEIAKQEITVMGHTDDVPIHATATMKMNPNNWILSTNRAWAVSDVLHADGVAVNRVSSAGWGDQRPIAPNAPGQRGNEMNRRVDIYIRPTTVPEGIVVSTPGSAQPRRSAPTPRRISPPAHPMHNGPTTAPATPGLPEGMTPTG